MRARPVWLLVSVWLLLAAYASPAIAQSTREQWLALRQNKKTERALAATAAGNNSATRTNVLTVTSLRFFSDASGRLVAVGEARNASAVTLSYARLEFVFYDAAGSYLGTEQAYLHGGRNKLVLVHGLHTNVLDSGRDRILQALDDDPRGLNDVAHRRVGGRELRRHIRGLAGGGQSA